MSTKVTFPQIVTIAQLCLAVSPEEVNELRRYFRRRHSIGAIMDPTGYRNEMKMAEKAETLVEAFNTFHSTVSKMRADELEELAAR